MLSHRPKCAINAQERYAEFPKLRQIDSLRPYIIKYDLFPARRDPETAPIRMEELKQLVRKWNLHQERNFWRNNTTKDDIVRVLYKYKNKLEKMRRRQRGQSGDGSSIGTSLSDDTSCMSDVYEALMLTGASQGAQQGLGSTGVLGGQNTAAGGRSTAGSPERKVNFSRQARKRRSRHTDSRGSVVFDATLNHALSVLSFSITPPNAVVASWKKRDIFKYDSGFIWLTRELSPEGVGYRKMELLSSFEGHPHAIAPVTPGTGRERMTPEEEGAVSALSSIAEPEMDTDSSTYVKLTCSLALLNISLRGEAEQIFLEQDGLKELLNLMNSTAEPGVLLNCCAAVVNITRNGHGMVRLFQSDVVPSLCRLARFDHEYVKQMAVLALCQLSSHEGTELWLIQEGGLQGLNQLLRAHNHYTRLKAIQGLVNLLAFLSIPRAETVTTSIMKQLCTLATIPDAEVQRLCADCLEVLSSFPGVRHLITEAGGVHIVSFLMHSGHLDEATMATCALAIASMSQVKKTRKDMVSNGICSILISLLKIGNYRTKVTCAQALNQLSREPELRENLVNDGVIPTLATLLLSDDEELALLAVLNLANFSCDPACRQAVADQDAGKALVAVLHTGALEVKKVALQAVGSLVGREAAFNCLTSWGLVEALHELVATRQHDQALSVTYFSMTTFEDARTLLAEKGLITSLLMLLSSEDTNVKVTCLAALQNMSLVENQAEVFKNTGVIQAVGDTMGLKDAAASQYAAAILHNLSQLEGLCKDIYDDGGVMLLVTLARAGNEQTKYYCAATLYNLSLRHLLTREPGFLQGLVELANTHMSGRLLLCAKIMSNASLHSKGRIAFGNNLPVLQSLCRALRSTAEDCEKIQYHAALAVCNSLSIYFKKGDIEEMVRRGIVNDLAVLMMLRVNEVGTKCFLAKALFNLMVREDTRELVHEQDVTQSLLRLMRLQAPELSQISIQTVANLSRELDRFGPKLAKMRAVNILLTEGTSRVITPDVKALCATALANLSFEPSCRRAMARDEFVIGLKSIAASVEGRVLEEVAAVFYNLAQDRTCHEAMLERKAIRQIVHMANVSTVAVVQELCLAALCTMSTTANAYVPLMNDALALVSTTMHTSTMPRLARLDAARLLCNLVTYHPPARKAAVDEKCIAALGELTKSIQEEEDMIMFGRALREISNCEDSRPGMIQDGAMNILFKLCKMDGGPVKLDAAHTLANLSYSKLRPALVEQEVAEVMFWLILEDCLQYNTGIYQRVSCVLRNLMQATDAVRAHAIMEDKFVEVAIKVSQYADEYVQLNAAVALYHIASTKRTQALAVKKGVVRAMIDLGEVGVPQIRQICSAAMHNLPPEANEGKTDPRLIKILMTMLHADTQKLSIVEQLSDAPRSKMDKQWEPMSGRYRYNRKEVKPMWQNLVIEVGEQTAPRGGGPAPFIPATAVMDPPKLNTDVMAVVGPPPAVKTVTGEFRKLPCKCDKFSPSALVLGVKGAHLTASARPPRAANNTTSTASNNSTTPLNTPLVDHTNTNNNLGTLGGGSRPDSGGIPCVGGGGGSGLIGGNFTMPSAEETRETLAAAMSSSTPPVSLVDLSEPIKLPPVSTITPPPTRPQQPTQPESNYARPSTSNERDAPGSTHPYAHANVVGYNIIAESDRVKHAMYMQAMARPRHLASSVQKHIVATSFAARLWGVQTAQVTVVPEQKGLSIGGADGHGGGVGGVRPRTMPVGNGNRGAEGKGKAASAGGVHAKAQQRPKGQGVRHDNFVRESTQES